MLCISVNRGKVVPFIDYLLYFIKKFQKLCLICTKLVLIQLLVKYREIKVMETILYLLMIYLSLSFIMTVHLICIGFVSSGVSLVS